VTRYTESCYIFATSYISSSTTVGLRNVDVNQKRWREWRDIRTATALRIKYDLTSMAYRFISPLAEDNLSNHFTLCSLPT
jgi:hypothetical protein